MAFFKRLPEGNNTTPVPIETRSPMFNRIVENLSPEHRTTILDFGPASNDNLEFFANYHSKLYILDVMNSLSAVEETIQKADDEKEIEWDKIVDDIIPTANAGPFDVVLCWDILNYMPRELLRRFMIKMEEYAQPGTLVHAYISTLSHLPEHPRTYRIIDQASVAHQPDINISKACPRYHQLDLSKLMPNFPVKGSVLLRNGMQEYIFYSKLSKAPPR